MSPVPVLAARGVSKSFFGNRVLNDVSIANDKGVLTLDAVAKTYRYLDEEEVAKQRRLAKEAKEKGKK